MQAKSDSTCLPNSQCSLKGHTIVYPQQPQGLIRILPLSVPDICTPICIIFVGSHKPSHEWLKTKAKPLIVCRERVHKALEWLQSHNPLYADIEIDYPTLQTFPEEEVLPYHIEHLQLAHSEEQEIPRASLIHVYSLQYPAEASNTTSHELESKGAKL